MTSVQLPSDRRFRRAHVAPSRRRPGRVARWRRAARIAALAVVGLGLASWSVTQLRSARVFAVSSVGVSGNTRISRADLDALLAGLAGANIVTLDLDRWRQGLLSSPWVEAAAVRRVLPNRVEVVLRERQPMAIGRFGGTLYLLDRAGEVITEYGPLYADLDLPLVDGLAAPAWQRDSIVDARGASLAVRLLADLEQRPDLLRLVSQVDVRDTRNAVVILRGDTANLRLGTTKFADRLQTYVDLAPTLRERLVEIDYVDLRFDERVFARPVAGTANARTGGAVNANGNGRAGGVERGNSSGR